LLVKKARKADWSPKPIPPSLSPELRRSNTLGSGIEEKGDAQMASETQKTVANLTRWLNEVVARGDWQAEAGFRAMARSW
jgi:hypothetical protein